MGDAQLQIVSLSHEVGLLLGNFMFVAWLRRVSPRKLMTVSTISTSALIMAHAVVIFLLPAPLSVKLVLIYIYEIITAALAVFLFMPILIMGAQLVTEGAEGTSYALVLSLQNLGGFLDLSLAAVIMNILGITEGSMDHLWYMSYFCAAVFMMPLLLLGMLPDSTYLHVNSKSE